MPKSYVVRTSKPVKFTRNLRALIIKGLRFNRSTPAITMPGLPLGLYKLSCPFKPSTLKGAILSSYKLRLSLPQRSMAERLVAIGYMEQIATAIFRAPTYYQFRKILKAVFNLPEDEYNAYMRASAVYYQLHTALNASLRPIAYPKINRKPTRKYHKATTDEIHCPLCETYISLPVRLTFSAPYETPFYLTSGTYSCSCGNTVVHTYGSSKPQNRAPDAGVASIKIKQQVPTELQFKRRVYTTMYGIPYYFRYTYYTYSPAKPALIVTKTTVNAFITKNYRVLVSPTADKERFVNHVDLTKISDNIRLLTLSNTPYLPYDPTPNVTYNNPTHFQASKGLVRNTNRLHHLLANYYTNIAIRYNIFVLLKKHIVTPMGITIPISRIPEASCTRYPEYITAVNRFIHSSPASIPHELPEYYRSLPTILHVFRHSRFDQFIPFKNEVISNIHSILLNSLSPIALAGDARRLTIAPSYYHPLATLNLPLYETSMHNPQTKAPSVTNSVDTLYKLYTTTAYAPTYSEMPSIFQGISSASSRTPHGARYLLDTPEAFTRTAMVAISAYATALRYHYRYLAYHLAEASEEHIIYTLPHLLSTLYPSDCQTAIIADQLSPLTPPVLSPLPTALQASLNHPTNHAHMHLAASFIP